MELNDPIPHERITLNGEPCFCTEGNRLALDYLQAARDALRKCDGMPNESGIKGALVASLEKFLSHCHHGSGCETCR
jgi:hypothetical protein